MGKEGRKEKEQVVSKSMYFLEIETFFGNGLLESLDQLLYD